MLIKGKSILFPVKIAETKYVASYSAKLVNGEEQLIITRDCRLYLTDGKGGYIEFKSINSGVTLLEVQNFINDLNEELSGKINETNNDLDTLTNTVNQLISDTNLKFDGYITKEEYEAKIQSYDNKIVEYDKAIKALEESINNENHTNRDVLDKFSEDTEGNPLYNNKKIVADFDTSEIEEKIADLKLRTHAGEKLDYFFGTIENKTFIPDTNIPITKCQSNSLELNSDNTITLHKNKTYTVEFCLNDVIGAWRIIYNVTDDKELQNYSRGDSHYQTNCSAIIETNKDIKIAFRVGRDTRMTASAISSYVKIQEIGREVLINEVEEVAKAKHIEDTPVGHIMSVMALTAPPHYLICDGAEYNIEDYPKLAEYFKNEFGAINYFGGDGINTFAVPDFRGEFVRGYDATNIKDPEGSTRGIGKHQDATLFPYIWSGSGIGVGELNTFPENMDLVNDATTTYKATTLSNAMYKEKKNYTSRPTNVNVLFCIKYESTYFMNYSPIYGGFNETVLFEGNANAIGEYALNDDCNNYNAIYVFSSGDNGEYNSSLLLKEANAYNKSIIINNSYPGGDRRLIFKINDYTLNMHYVGTGGYRSHGIVKIVGIKTNSNTITTDNEIQIDSIVYTDDEIKAALDNITGGDN